MPIPELDRNAWDNLDLETLIMVAERRASKVADGHLTIMRFTTGWKAMFHTPNLLGPSGYDEVRQLQPFPTLKEAIMNLLLSY